MSEPTSPLVTWPATPDDVASLLRARTQDDTDVEVGSWTDSTRPTLAEVERILEMAASSVVGRTGPLTPEVLICNTAEDVMTQAATCVALLAAMLVELSYFPEQVQSSRSAYDQYHELLYGPDGKSGMMGDLVGSVSECAAGGVEPDPGEGVNIPKPSYAFPADRGGMVGWRTRW
jgi:hypothetical protein